MKTTMMMMTMTTMMKILIIDTNLFTGLSDVSYLLIVMGGVIVLALAFTGAGFLYVCVRGSQARNDRVLQPLSPTGTLNIRFDTNWELRSSSY